MALELLPKLREKKLATRIKKLRRGRDQQRVAHRRQLLLLLLARRQQPEQRVQEPADRLQEPHLSLLQPGQGHGSRGSECGRIGGGSLGCDRAGLSSSRLVQKALGHRRDLISWPVCRSRDEAQRQVVSPGKRRLLDDSWSGVCSWRVELVEVGAAQVLVQGAVDPPSCRVLLQLFSGGPEREPASLNHVVVVPRVFFVVITWVLPRPAPPRRAASNKAQQKSPLPFRPATKRTRRQAAGLTGAGLRARGSAEDTAVWRRCGEDDASFNREAEMCAHVYVSGGHVSP
ncbi:hypothetical protein EYF80_017814 [Liparis tanakae]|uniref:Uncharacterized protein n=1 Tax=Liparis tanakae TaxID=230148 RepID=A0A4Z2I1S7_9TELE|nr:hypothetical protein EYF80_017814 [Liparis tanakae]